MKINVKRRERERETKHLFTTVSFQVSLMFSSFTNKLISYLPTLPVFPGVSKFFIKSPGLPVKPPNLPGTTYRGFFPIFFFTNFVIFAISKKKIKQEMDLVLLFSAFI